MIGWKQDKAWSDGLMGDIKAVLGRHLIGEADAYEDQEHCTDLVVLRLDAVRIACRVRRHQYYTSEQYRGEFTLRSKRPSGAITELSKIIAGWGDYMLYGFADENGLRLVAYTLSDLKHFRLWFCRQLSLHGGRCPGVEIPNGDQSSMFRVFKWADMPSAMIVGQEGIAHEA
jgi:hypothetical protein